MSEPQPNIAPEGVPEDSADEYAFYPSIQDLEERAAAMGIQAEFNRVEPKAAKPEKSEPLPDDQIPKDYQELVRTARENGAKVEFRLSPPVEPVRKVVARKLGNLAAGLRGRKEN
jgi:hypothetical protein